MVGRSWVPNTFSSRTLAPYLKSTSSFVHEVIFMVHGPINIVATSCFFAFNPKKVK
jgi:hypothetical protein